MNLTPEKIGKLKKQPMMRLSDSNPVLYFVLLTALLHLLLSILRDTQQLTLGISTPLSATYSLPLLISLVDTLRRKEIWKKIKKIEANQNIEPTVKTPVE